jgi:hypothetical protein
MMDIVERIRSRIHDSHMQIEHLLDEAADEIERLRLAKLPNWAQAALTSSTADITVTGKTLSDQQMRDWLATIPEPIEPNASSS